MKGLKTRLSTVMLDRYQQKYIFSIILSKNTTEGESYTEKKWISILKYMYHRIQYVPHAPVE